MSYKASLPGKTSSKNCDVLGLSSYEDNAWSKLAKFMKIRLGMKRLS